MNDPTAERIRGGWITRGTCGAHHLSGYAYTWWRCTVCAVLTPRARRRESTRALRRKHDQMMNLYYPKDPE